MKGRTREGCQEGHGAGGQARAEGAACAGQVG